MYDIDVNGTQNVLEAASAAGVEHLLVASSTTAYGAFPDNPVPLTGGAPGARHCPPTSTRATRPRSTACASCGRHSTRTAR